MNDFERIRDRYYRNYVTFEQLRRYCKLGVITPEQFKEISGEEYESGDRQ